MYLYILSVLDGVQHWGGRERDAWPTKLCPSTTDDHNLMGREQGTGYPARVKVERMHLDFREGMLVGNP